MNTTDKAMHEAFKNSFCPYKGSPDPWVVWQAAWLYALASSAAAPEQANSIESGGIKKAQPAPAAGPDAWRLRIGDSPDWCYTSSEIDADFIGRQSGRAYIKERLATQAQPAPAAEAEQAEPVGINGLTDAETDASASVSGLIAAPAADAWGRARFDAWWGGDGRGLHGCEMNRDTAVQVWIAALETRPSAPLSEGPALDLGALGNSIYRGAVRDCITRVEATHMIEGEKPLMYREAILGRLEDMTVDTFAPHIPALRGMPATVAHRPSAPLSEPTAEGVTDDQWIELAERHATRDWNSDTLGGYLNAVKALCTDFAALSSPASSAGMDAQRLDWLAMQVVEVRTPLVYGSRANFITSPKQDDPAFEAEPSDLRQRIDAAIASKEQP